MGLRTTPLLIFAQQRAKKGIDGAGFAVKISLDWIDPFSRSSPSAPTLYTAISSIYLNLLLRICYAAVSS